MRPQVVAGLLFVFTALVADRSAPPPFSSVSVQHVVEQVHIPPVDGPVLDPFRRPDQPWQAGNRGIEYLTEPGSIAVASADGVVTFAGAVAGSLHVTIRHSPDLVTTIAFVSEILVEVGQTVSQGEPVAVVGASVHFTARRNGEYIDPELLFGSWSWVVRLVPPVR